MRFSFFTVIFTGVICALFQLLFAVTFLRKSSLANGDSTEKGAAYFVLFIFGIIAVFQLVSAYKINTKMRANVEREMQNSFLNA